MQISNIYTVIRFIGTSEQSLLNEICNRRECKHIVANYNSTLRIHRILLGSEYGFIRSSAEMTYQKTIR